MIAGKFDLNSFFRQGFTVNSLNEQDADLLLEYIEAEQFIKVNQAELFEESPNHSDSLVQYPEMWSQGGQAIQAFTKTEHKDHLLNYWDRAATDFVTWFETTFGNFDFKTMLAHRFSVGQEIGFHSDYIEATYMGIIVYLGDRDYSRDDGGYLQLGICDVDANGLPIPNSINVIEEVLPNHGTVVTVCNLNPCFLHRVVPLVSKKKRLTHACRLGFLSNRASKKEINRGGYL